MANPIEITGTIARSQTTVSIEIDSGSLTAMSGLEDGQPVHAIVWDARPLSELPLVEQLSEVQQLERTVIAQGLKSRGAITDKVDFLKRLSLL